MEEESEEVQGQAHAREGRAAQETEAPLFPRPRRQGEVTLLFLFLFSFHVFLILSPYLHPSHLVRHIYLLSPVLA